MFKGDATRLKKNKSSLNLITGGDLSKVEDIIVPEVNQGKKTQAEEEVNEEARSEDKGKATVQEQEDDAERAMKSEEDGDKLQQIRENFREGIESLTTATHERMEERECLLVKTKTKTRKKGLENAKKTMEEYFQNVDDISNVTGAAYAKGKTLEEWLRNTGQRRRKIKYLKTED